MPVTLEDGKGVPFLTEDYVFRMEISPVRSDNSWASPPSFAQQNTCGSGSSGTTFVLTDEDTNKLNFRLGYNWRVLAMPPGTTPYGLIGGGCTVLDEPSIPEVNPL